MSEAEEIRNMYEPLYGRHLSDAEVREIRKNLTAFARGLLQAAMYPRKKKGIKANS